MSNFEKTNWSWQWSQFQQRVGEWLEYQFSRLQPARSSESQPGWSIPPWFDNLLDIIFWLIVGLFVAWVLWLLWREFSPYLYRWLSETGRSQSNGTQNNQIELSVSDILARSQDFYRQGNYRDACRCLYLAMLQQLNDKEILPHKLSRTDGEYLQLLQLSVTPIQPYETLITTHEKLCFSDAEISADSYQQCDQALKQLNSPQLQG